MRHERLDERLLARMHPPNKPNWNDIWRMPFAVFENDREIIKAIKGNIPIINIIYDTKSVSCPATMPSPWKAAVPMRFANLQCFKRKRVDRTCFFLKPTLLFRIRAGSLTLINNKFKNLSSSSKYTFLLTIPVGCKSWLPKGTAGVIWQGGERWNSPGFGMLYITY